MENISAVLNGGDDDWDSSGSSEGEYVETTSDPLPSNRTSGPTCLEYNQNEMSIIVKSVAEETPLPKLQRNRPIITNPVHESESEAIICSPQILFDIKPEPLDENDDEMGELEEVDMEHLGHHIKMEIVEDENYEEVLLAQDRHGRRLPPPLLIPLQSANRQQQSSGGGLSDAEKKLRQYMQTNNGEQSRTIEIKAPSSFPQFILRNPRGNQPRSYTTENLWAALMDVKSGESIYR